MPRVTLPKTTASGSYPTTGVTLTFTAADASSLNQFVFTGSELIIARNTGASTRTITITSIADATGRTGSIAAENITTGQYRIYGPFTKKAGWAQAGGYFFLQASHAEVEFAIVLLPTGA